MHMNQKMRLPAIFQKYAGVTIPHEDFEHISKRHPEKKRTAQRPTAEGKALIEEISQVAAANKVNLRLWTPDAMGSTDSQPSRLNIRTSEDWVIKDECYYG